MRAWGLATGLRDNGHSVTVGIFDEFKQDRKIHDGVKLYNWKLDDDFKTYINTFDTVIVGYNMGDPSVFIAENLSHHITLVLDCYVPIYIEISARNSDDKAGELNGYLYEINRFNKVLQRGDFFLCANEPQKHMYMGILGSLGVINPYTYSQKRLLVVPFGVDDKPLTVAKGDNPYTHANKDDFVLLWFGGLYPWFNFKPLIEAVKQLSIQPNFKFYLVGGKNPYNGHPDFSKQYDYVIAEFKKLGLLGTKVFTVDWIDFDERIRWYQHADLVISINSPGEENVYSWRTRVMDYLWGELPMLTNGGDPLSDELIAHGGAVKIGLETDEIVSTIERFMTNRSDIASLQSKLLAIKKTYFWTVVTKPLSDLLSSDDNHPYINTLTFMHEHHISGHASTGSRTPGKARKAASKVKSYAKRARQKGIKRSARFALSIAKSQAKSILSTSSLVSEPRAFFLSHPMNHTGAPLVLLDVIHDFSEVIGERNIHIAAPAIEKDIHNDLLNKAYTIHKMADGIGGRIIQANLGIKPDDFVLMNTVALYANYRTYIYWMLESGKLKKAHWFIHEDNPSLHFQDDKEVARIKRLLSDGKLAIVVPSIQTAKEYNEFFDTNTITNVTLRVSVPEKYKTVRDEADFDVIKFFISGIPLDGRKGQLQFLAALQLFEAKYRSVNPKAYRPYTLDLVSIGSDYISEQIKSIGKAVVGKDLKIHPVVNRSEALKIARTCNVTVCSSLNETFALFVAEGMLMGHPILRNDTSGWQEQIQNTKNGYFFKMHDVEDLTEAIRKLLDKKASNASLVRMGVTSQKIAEAFSNANYYEQLKKEPGHK